MHWRNVLQAMGVAVLRIEGAPDADALTSLLNNWIAAGPVQGVYWLPALDQEEAIRKLDLQTWHEGLRVGVKSLYTTMRALYEQRVEQGDIPRVGNAAGWASWL